MSESINSLSKTANQKTENWNGIEFWELGYTFKPMVKGSINSLILYLFNNVPSVRITIWDATTKAILLTETATNILANTEKKISITPFILEKDKAYVISMNTKFYFKKSKNDFSSVVYPVTVGNISVLRNNFRPSWITRFSKCYCTYCGYSCETI